MSAQQGSRLGACLCKKLTTQCNSALPALRLVNEGLMQWRAPDQYGLDVRTQVSRPEGHLAFTRLCAARQTAGGRFCASCLAQPWLGTFHPQITVSMCVHPDLGITLPRVLRETRLDIKHAQVPAADCSVYVKGKEQSIPRF